MADTDQHIGWGDQDTAHNAHAHPQEQSEYNEYDEYSERDQYPNQYQDNTHHLHAHDNVHNTHAHTQNHEQQEQEMHAPPSGEYG